MVLMVAVSVRPATPVNPAFASVSIRVSLVDMVPSVDRIDACDRRRGVAGAEVSEAVAECDTTTRDDAGGAQSWREQITRVLHVKVRKQRYRRCHGQHDAAGRVVGFIAFCNEVSIVGNCTDVISTWCPACRAEGK